MRGTSSSGDGEPISDFVESGSEGYRELMSNWTTGVSIVTAYDGSEPAGCTVSSLTSVSLRPPLLLIGLARASRMFRILMDAQTFCVNILAARQQGLSTKFAAEVHHSERFSDVAMTDVAGSPMLDGCLANVVCAVHTEFVVGDRALVVGQPLQHRATPEERPLVIFRRSPVELKRPHPSTTGPLGAAHVHQAQRQSATWTSR
jgi:3-hydroxy-9,10-secoandrosta-1,3,5(10)-triene-9,17-dione monooxygenase reductase component